jgi:hypothetical protein
MIVRQGWAFLFAPWFFLLGLGVLLDGHLPDRLVATVPDCSSRSTPRVHPGLLDACDRGGPSASQEAIAHRRRLLRIAHTIAVIDSCSSVWCALACTLIMRARKNGDRQDLLGTDGSSATDRPATEPTRASGTEASGYRDEARSITKGPSSWPNPCG